MLLMQRARILKKAASKPESVDQILQDFSLTSSLIYCADVEQLEDIRHVIQTHQIPYAIYIGSTSKEERQSSLDALNKGNIPILLAIDCLDEGVDVPAIREAVIIASSTNKRQFIQRRGRVLRQSLDKKQAILIDVIAIPPKSAGSNGKNLLMNELARAKEMAELAENRYEAMLQVKRYTEPFGVMLAELLTGESDE
jgi:superfamily II DNA or RNA helicase